MPPLLALAFDQVDKLLVRVDVELGIDMLDVGLDGVARNAQALLDVLAIAPASKHLEDLCLARRKLVSGRDLGAPTGKDFIGRDMDLDVGLGRHDALDRGAQRKPAQAKENVGDKNQQHDGDKESELLVAGRNLDVVCRGTQKGAQRRCQA